MTRTTRRRFMRPGLAGIAVLAASSQALFAQTDHFKCYQAQEIFVEQARDAELTDAFGGDPEVRIHNAAWFCNPVSKTVGEEAPTPITEPANHLTLYPLSNTNPSPPHRVTIDNQFGTRELVITSPRLVAVPTRKDDEPDPQGISHFKCHQASGRPIHVRATLADQFQTESARILQPRYLCNPATKTLEGVTTAPEPGEASLTCYTITPGGPPPVDFIDFDNQIGAPDIMRIGPSNFLCVPTTVAGGEEAATDRRYLRDQRK